MQTHTQFMKQITTSLPFWDELDDIVMATQRHLKAPHENWPCVRADTVSWESLNLPNSSVKFFGTI